VNKQRRKAGQTRKGRGAARSARRSRSR
jgi:hypothetical protein